MAHSRASLEISTIYSKERPPIAQQTAGKRVINDKSESVLASKGQIQPILAPVNEPKMSAQGVNLPLSDPRLSMLDRKRPESAKDEAAAPISHQVANPSSNTPGNIILTNIKTSEPRNQQLHALVSQLVERIQILVPNLARQDRVQLVLEQGPLKGTEITILLQNNRLTITLVHSSQNAELLQQMRPELLERLQRINTDQQVRIITTHEQQAHEGHQQQDQQQESSQKSRIVHDWLEEQNDA